MAWRRGTRIRRLVLAVLAPLRTRFARRVLALFVISALIPIFVLAAISYWQVTRQLELQARDRVRQASKTVGFAVMERLDFLSEDLGSVVMAYRRSGNLAPLREGLSGRFTSIVVRSADGTSTSILGEPFEPPNLPADAREHLTEGRAYLAVPEPEDDGETAVLLAREAGGARGEVLWAQLNAPYVWVGRAASASVPPEADMCVLGANDVALYCTTPELGTVLGRASREQGEGEGVFTWTAPDGTDGVGARWVLFLRFEFATPNWTVVLSEPRASALAALAEFRVLFPPVIVLTLLVVLLLSNVQIRRNLQPLRALHRHTGRLTSGDFTARVAVESGDEFEEVAGAFNVMTERLGRQFNALAAVHQIDQAVLRTPQVDAVAAAVLSGARTVLGRDEVAVILRGARVRGNGVAVDAFGPAGALRDVESTWFRPLERESSESVVVSDGGGSDALPKELWGTTVDRVVLFPAYRGGVPAAALVLGYGRGHKLTDEDRRDGIALANQLAVGLANARLIEDLDALTWGAVTALGRTIDAKSRWTSGHSERVTRLSLALAEVLGFDDATLKTLHRGGLLHDIGKIGVPGSVLNKPGKLTEEEWKVMRDHVTVGARILRPIKAYEDTIPIVLYHHERWDGSGYPEGRIGTDIPLLARVLAVPDVYDALTSDRPYRSGWKVEDVIEFIDKGAGSLFDSEIVAALPEALKRPAAIAGGSVG